MSDLTYFVTVLIQHGEECDSFSAIQKLVTNFAAKPTEQELREAIGCNCRYTVVREHDYAKDVNVPHACVYCFKQVTPGKVHVAFLCAWHYGDEKRDNCAHWMRCQEIETKGPNAGEVIRSHGICEDCAKRVNANCTCGPVSGEGSIIDVQTCDWCRAALDFKTDAMHERKEPAK